MNELRQILELADQMEQLSDMIFYFDETNSHRISESIRTIKRLAYRELKSKERYYLRYHTAQNGDGVLQHQS